MKIHRINFLLLSTAVILSLFSCATSPEKKIDSVYVMVYDFDNNEVMNVSIFIDGKVVGKTDIYGRLMFPCVKEKLSVIKAEKEGYEKLENTTVLKAALVLYFKMGSSNYYATEAEKLLDENNLVDALKMIDKALEIQERKDYQYLKDVILRRSENEE